MPLEDNRQGEDHDNDQEEGSCDEQPILFQKGFLGDLQREGVVQLTHGFSPVLGQIAVVHHQDDVAFGEFHLIENLVHFGP